MNNSASIRLQVLMVTLTSLRAAGIFFCFLPDGILCNTEDKALVGDL